MRYPILLFQCLPVAVGGRLDEEKGADCPCSRNSDHRRSRNCSLCSLLSHLCKAWDVADRRQTLKHRKTRHHKFVMNNMWRIEWIINRQDDNLFIVAAFIKTDNGYSSVADASEADTDTTRGILPVPYTGTFVIRVIASDETEWTLYIEEFKPA